MDLSKEATRLAARRHPEICFFVADVKRRLLFADNALYALLNVFAPRNPSEFGRVLAPGGLLLIAIPTPAHLETVRATFGLLDVEQDKRENVMAQMTGLFEAQGEQRIAYEIKLDGPQLENLIRMTPNYWHTSQKTWEAIQSTKDVKVTVSFDLLAWKKLAEPGNRRERGYNDRTNTAIR
jgi:23S rRNA (guanine745-N1)-methyltransferase